VPFSAVLVEQIEPPLSLPQEEVSARDAVEAALGLFSKRSVSLMRFFSSELHQPVRPPFAQWNQIQNASSNALNGPLQPTLPHRKTILEE